MRSGMRTRYRKVSPRVWGDEKFRQLSDDGKLAFLFLLTHPHLTALGALRASLPGLASEMGWPGARFRRAVKEAVALGMVEVNEPAGFVGLPNYLKHNQPEGPNSVVHAWVQALEGLPECPERSGVAQRALLHLLSRSGAFQAQVGQDIFQVLKEAAAEGAGGPIRDGMGHGMPDGIRDAMPDGIAHPGAGTEAGAGTGASPPMSPPKGGAPSVEDGFAQFWARYPRKVGKGGAEKAWRKNTRGVPLEDILAGLRRWERSKAWEEGFVPLPATWVGQRRWEDDPEPSDDYPTPGPAWPIQPRGVRLPPPPPAAPGTDAAPPGGAGAPQAGTEGGGQARGEAGDAGRAPPAADGDVPF